jgi:hypothetical protein
LRTEFEDAFENLEALEPAKPNKEEEITVRAWENANVAPS